MNQNYAVIVVGWIITTIALVKFIPRGKFQEAQVVFLFNQLITWITGLAVVELRLIEYPVRLFFIC